MNYAAPNSTVHQKLRLGDRLLVGNVEITVKRTAELTLRLPSDIPVTRDESGRKSDQSIADFRDDGNLTRKITGRAA